MHSPSSSTCRRRVLACITVGILSSLAGCGGGGSDGEADLTVGFSYANFASPLFLPVQSQPLLSGLGSNTPECSISSGSLPPGESLGPGCSIVGMPTQVGSYSASIKLTVDGFKGSVSASVLINVEAPVLQTIPGSAVGPDQTIPLGMPLPVAGVATVTVGTFAGPYVPQAGDSVVFSVGSGSLPPGLALDAATGALTGTPTAFGLTTFSVALTVTHAGVAYTTPAVPVEVSVVESPFTLTYGACCGAADVGDPVSLRPTSTYIAVPGATVVFGLGPDVPPGIAIDPTTGAIGGVFSAAGTFTAFVSETVRLPDDTVLVADSPLLTWQITGPAFSYDSTVLPVFGGTPFSFVPGPITGGMPGDVYGFSLAPFSSTDTLPAWVHIDPVTGELHGTSPVLTTFAPSVGLRVTLTTTRRGVAFTTSQRVDLVLN